MLLLFCRRGGRVGWGVGRWWWTEGWTCGVFPGGCPPAVVAQSLSTLSAPHTHEGPPQPSKTIQTIKLGQTGDVIRAGKRLYSPGYDKRSLAWSAGSCRGVHDSRGLGDTQGRFLCLPPCYACDDYRKLRQNKSSPPHRAPVIESVTLTVHYIPKQYYSTRVINHIESNGIIGSLKNLTTETRVHGEEQCCVGNSLTDEIWIRHNDTTESELNVQTYMELETGRELTMVVQTEENVKSDYPRLIA